MNCLQPIYTEKNDCQDCYKCLRQCPVKAIKIEGGSASIIPGQCIYCGHCVLVCPVEAKKVRNDIPQLLNLLNGGSKVVVSLAPSWVSEFPGMSSGRLSVIFSKLGFYGVSETALGAEIISKQTAEWISEQPAGVYISSCCPSVVQLVCRHYPELKQNLVPIISPMQAHAQMLREIYGNDIHVAFFGPCIAKKTETGPTYADLALTFSDLKELLNQELPGWERTIAVPGKSFIPFQAGKGNFFPVDGGMIANLKSKAEVTELSYMSFSGINQIKDTLSDIKTWNTTDRIFLELLVCEGGCIKGPGTISSASAAFKRQTVLTTTRQMKPQKYATNITGGLAASFDEITITDKKYASDDEIASALHAAGKFNPSDELNCGACGYDSCRDFAHAMVEGKAERMMCATYTRQVAQGKASVLLKKIPYGVVIADENLKIIDSNRKFAEILGGEVLALFESTNSLEKADLKKLVSFHKMFTSVLQTGEEMIEHTIRTQHMMLHLSVVTIQPKKIVCGVIQNMYEPEVRNDMIKQSVKKVIHQNMQVVQKIAYLLGENASFTESMLNSIIESEGPESLNDYNIM
jgi:iron only hydrogenase large subunit-like protein/uncharacterized Fe-S cluster-containing protein